MRPAKKPTKVCATCTHASKEGCQVARSTSLPASVRWMAIEHLNALEEGVVEDCFSYVEAAKKE